MAASNIKERTMELLMSLKVPANLKGFRYICTAMEFAEKDPEFLDNLTKSGGVYCSVAEVHNTTPSRVERAIRHAISHMKVPSKYFPEGTRMTNGSVLVILYYALSMKGVGKK